MCASPHSLLTQSISKKIEIVHSAPYNPSTKIKSVSPANSRSALLQCSFLIHKICEHFQYSQIFFLCSYIGNCLKLVGYCLSHGRQYKTPPKRNWLCLLDKKKLFYSWLFLGYRYLPDGLSETMVDNNPDLLSMGLGVIF